MLSTTRIKALQVWAGKLVHVLQFRRRCFSNLEEVFKKVIAKGQTSQEPGDDVPAGSRDGAG